MLMNPVLMGPDNRAADHHVFILIVVISGRMTEDPLDHTLFTPATQTLMHIFLVPETEDHTMG